MSEIPEVPLPPEAIDDGSRPSVDDLKFNLGIAHRCAQFGPKERSTLYSDALSQIKVLTSQIAELRRDALGETERTMLTDEEAALAKAEYDALPGTLPSGYSSADLRGLDRLGWVRETAAMWRKQGMQHLRVTIDGQVIWMEVWAEQPVKEAPFRPPYTTEGKTASQGETK